MKCPHDWEKVVIGAELWSTGGEVVLKACAYDECRKDGRQKQQCVKPIPAPNRLNDMNLRPRGRIKYLD